jgi:triacylglycerol esterase/lipase EstA (alpha/beta hydrolase family)
MRSGQKTLPRKMIPAVCLLAVTAGCSCSERTEGDGENDLSDDDGEPDPIEDESREDAPGPAEREDAPEDPSAEDVTVEELELPPPCDPEHPRQVERGDLALDDSLDGVALEACTEHLYAIVAAAGMTVRVSLASDRVHPVRAAVVYPDDPSWDSPLMALYSGWNPVEDTLDVPRSGEFFILVRSGDPREPSTYDLAVECAEGCDLLATRFPVVLVHGWTGFSEIGPIEYYYGVVDDLTPRGYLLYVAELDPYNSTEIRSGQLAGQVDGFLVEGRARKVNLVAHSQGGLDARRVVSTLGYGDRVGAIATIAAPHRGTPIADIALGILPGPGEEALFFLLNLIGATATGREQEARDSFASISEDYVVGTFNPENPDDPRVAYLSWTGLTCLLGGDCGDVCDVEITWSYILIYDESGDNDGMVPVESGRWGDYLGEIPADHFDEVGQLLGVTNPNFDHLEFYRGVVGEIADRGL